MPIHEPELNPESFILYEDDEWFSAMQFTEPQPEESPIEEPQLEDPPFEEPPLDESLLADQRTDDLSVRKYFIIPIIIVTDNDQWIF